MTQTILVATIGTRDLALYCDEYSQQWLNIGNASKSNVDGEDSQAVRVQYELGISDTFRNVTKYLLENWEQYQDKIKPIIIGKLIEDKKDTIKTVYLIVTDQINTTNLQYYRYDTLYSGHIIQKYLQKHYKFETKVFIQGNEPNNNPANFEQMFLWWEQFWDAIAPKNKNNQNLILCLKGGVNQSSEAARITSITRFEEKVIFYDFEENTQNNLAGIPSPYTKPFIGVNYLWSRKKAEALSLLKRHDYEGVNSILKPYYQDGNNEYIRKLKLYLGKAIKWNITDFDTFIKDLQQIPNDNWWWKGYESAYLGFVRFKQGNNIEAFFHAFRAIEGLMSELINFKYKNYVIFPRGETPYLKSSICDKNSPFPEFKKQRGLFNQDGRVYLYGSGLDSLVEIALPQIKNEYQWKRFFVHIKPWRNRIFHRLKHLEKGDLFNVCWEVQDVQLWKKRVLYYLNFLSGQYYPSLEKASFMAEYHKEIKDLIQRYQPK
ncbi:hypothetical protein WEU38_01025 [Cyanobacterium aponinum AL20118]|uniref:CRISPR-associated protein n=1 Tax=Cyanobacterium aponinum AL20115 TaxID=3090662 RepID=A0AAF1C6F7_9CHRO|nr:hypothetical protein [Cyanobacterium aponinum]PHV61573.1 hypothetical protein CSQ80_14745 [Cyanobacterium aponinum IPPAS B-1201]WPF88884.1 hypothetical protein SAY89_01030 [Cyanobacterium aponinum AL20115]